MTCSNQVIPTDNMVYSTHEGTLREQYSEGARTSRTLFGENEITRDSSFCTRNRCEERYMKMSGLC